MEKEKSGKLSHMVSGSISGAVASMVVQPLDVIRTRLQQQKAGIDTQGFKSSSMIEVGKRIVQIDGIKGLWRGTGPTLYRVIPGAGFYFFFLNLLSTSPLINPDPSQPLSPTISLIVGSLSRSLVTISLLPVTVVKTRFEAFGAGNYKSTPHALKTIFQQEGFRSLFSGLLPTVVRDVPFSGIYFLFYQQTKLGFKNLGVDFPHTFTNIVSGLIAGMIATATTHPTDVIKTRVQLPSGEKNPKKMMEVISKLAKEEGLRGFYSGFMPRLIRRPLLTALTWAIYEELKLFM